MTNRDAINLLEEVKMLDDTMYAYNPCYEEALDMALTALKAEETWYATHEYPPEQRWIPVTERLPENDKDYKSCIECLDGAVWYFTANGSIGLGYYYESTKEWSTTDDLKTDGKVIAWMPLPEPWKEGEAE